MNKEDKEHYIMKGFHNCFPPDQSPTFEPSGPGRYNIIIKNVEVSQGESMHDDKGELVVEILGHIFYVEDIDGQWVAQ